MDDKIVADLQAHPPPIDARKSGRDSLGRNAGGETQPGRWRDDVSDSCGMWGDGAWFHVGGAGQKIMIEVGSSAARLPEVLIVLGIACLLAGSLIGSYVDEEGWLHEPFFLIPIGFFLIATGVVAWIVRKLRRPEQP